MPFHIFRFTRNRTHRNLINIKVEKEEAQCEGWKFLVGLAGEQNDLRKQAVILVKYFFFLLVILSYTKKKFIIFQKRPRQLPKTAHSTVVRAFV